MAPTLKSGELVVICQGADRTIPLHRGDIVAARPSSFGGRAFVKRLIGLPLEAVEVDGRQWQLGADEFFLLGDRIEHSLDSRTFGPVTRQELIGLVQLRVWPWKLLRQKKAQEAADGQTAEMPGRGRQLRLRSAR